MLIKLIFNKIILLITLLLFLISCMKKDKFPNQPEIKFKDIFLIKDNNGVITNAMLQIEFTDGDGDIGLSSNETQPPFDSLSIYYNNFFINYYEKQNGNFVKLNLNPPLHARIPVINTSNFSQPLKGTIEIITLVNFLSIYDTIYYECQIADRALNLSNIVKSPIIIKK